MKNFIFRNLCDEKRLLHLAFEEIVVAYPYKPALRGHGVELTYQKLNEQANSLANYLCHLNLMPNCEQPHAQVLNTIRIGIYLPQSANIPISILAIMKAGYVFVPLSTDPEISKERLETIINDVKPQAIITSHQLDGKRIHEFAKQQKTEIIYLEDIMSSLAIFSNKNLNKKVSNDSLAYIIYTSGSTGIPKGVMIPHKGLLNCIESTIDKLNIDTNAEIAQLTSIGFDPCIMEIFIAFLSGARLHVVPRDQEGRLLIEKLSQFYSENAISIGIFTPSLLSLLEPNEFNSLKKIIYTGEKPFAAIIERWFHNTQCQGYDGYGPSECSIGATFDGICMKGITVLLLEFDEYENTVQKESLDCVEAGEIGEIYLTGDCVGLGYWNNEELTKQKFRKIKNPNNINQDILVYQTGDLGCITEDNILCIKGRIGRQVKIHGKLICPSEIEHVLITYSKNIYNVFVDSLVYSDEQAPRFIAFLFIKEFALLQQENNLPDIYDMQLFLRSKLTNSMIPIWWIFLPIEASNNILNTNKKIDRFKLWEFWLSQKNYPIQLAKGYRSLIPRDEKEQIIIDIWLKQLKSFNEVNLQENKHQKITFDLFKQVETLRFLLSERLPSYQPTWDDHFFNLGGTSLQLVSLLRQLYNALDLKINFSGFMDNPTLGYLIRAYRHKKILQKKPSLQCLNGNFAINQLLPEKIIPIFLLHSLVGDAELDYRQLIQHLPAEMPAFGLNAISLNHPQLMADSFQEMANNYLEEIDKIYCGNIYILAGWSGGGLIALAMQALLEQRQCKIAVIMFDTASPIAFQNMPIKSFHRFLRSLIFGKSNPSEDAHSIRSRIPLTDPVLENIFSGLSDSWPKRKTLFYLFELLKQQVSISTDSKHVKKEAFGLLSTVENILLAALQQTLKFPPKEMTLIVAKESQIRFKDERLLWPQHWPMHIKQTDGNHFFMLNDELVNAIKFPLLVKKQQAILSAHSFIAKLKKYYSNKQNSEISHALGKRLSIESCYINLMIIPSQLQQRKEQHNLREYAGRSEIINSYENIYSAEYRELIKFENIFISKKMKNSDITQNARRILITGRAGIGKTILCQWGVWSWSKKKIWPECKILLWLKFREINEIKFTSITDVLKHAFRELLKVTQFSSKKLMELLLHLKDEAILILDGYDEYNVHYDKKNFDIIERMIRELPCRIILTSRPLAAPPQEWFDLHLENIGFNTNDIKKFIRYYYPKKKKSKFIENFLKDNKSIYSLSHIPINLALICTAYTEIQHKVQQKNALRLTITEIYIIFINKLLTNHLLNRPGIRKEKFFRGHLSRVIDEKLEELFLKELLSLEYYAFHGMKNNQIILDEHFLHDKKILNEIKNAILALKTSKKETLPLLEDILSLGILHIASEKNGKIKSCYFIHLTIQEYFAARCWVRQLTSDNPEQISEAERFFLLNKYNLRYEYVWIFAAGMLDEKTKKRFFTLLSAEPKDLIGFIENNLIMRCLEESQFNQDDIYFQQLLLKVCNWIELSFDGEAYFNELNDILYENLKFCPSIFQSEAFASICNKRIEKSKVPNRYRLNENIIETMMRCLEIIGYIDETTIKMIFDSGANIYTDDELGYVELIRILVKMEKVTPLIIEVMAEVFDSDRGHNAIPYVIKYAEHCPNIIVLLLNAMNEYDTFGGGLIESALPALLTLCKRNKNYLEEVMLIALNKIPQKYQNEFVDKFSLNLRIKKGGLIPSALEVLLEYAGLYPQEILVFFQKIFEDHEQKQIFINGLLKAEKNYLSQFSAFRILEAFAMKFRAILAPIVQLMLSLYPKIRDKASIAYLLLRLDYFDNSTLHEIHTDIMNEEKYRSDFKDLFKKKSISSVYHEKLYDILFSIFEDNPESDIANTCINHILYEAKKNHKIYNKIITYIQNNEKFHLWVKNLDLLEDFETIRDLSEAKFSYPEMFVTLIKHLTLLQNKKLIFEKKRFSKILQFLISLSNMQNAQLLIDILCDLLKKKIEIRPLEECFKSMIEAVVTLTSLSLSQTKKILIDLSQNSHYLLTRLYAFSALLDLVYEPLYSEIFQFLLKGQDVNDYSIILSEIIIKLFPSDENCIDLFRFNSTIGTKVISSLATSDKLKPEFTKVLNNLLKSDSPWLVFESLSQLVQMKNPDYNKLISSLIALLQRFRWNKVIGEVTTYLEKFKILPSYLLTELFSKVIALGYNELSIPIVNLLFHSALNDPSIRQFIADTLFSENNNNKQAILYSFKSSMMEYTVAAPVTTAIKLANLDANIRKAFLHCLKTGHIVMLYVAEKINFENILTLFYNNLTLLCPKILQNTTSFYLLKAYVETKNLMFLRALLLKITHGESLSITLDNSYLRLIEKNGEVYSIKFNDNQVIIDCQKVFNGFIFSNVNIIKYDAVSKSLKNYFLAKKSFSEGKYDKIKGLNEEILKINPQFIPALSLNSKVSLQLKQYDESLKVSEELLSINPNLAVAYRVKGDALVELERYDEADICYDKALSLKPTYTRALNGKGFLLECIGNFSEALIYYSQSLTICETDYILCQKAKVLVKLNQKQEALTLFKRAIEINPKYDHACYQYTKLLVTLSRFRDALKNCNILLKNHPEKSSYIKLKISILIKLQQFQKAKIFFQENQQSLSPNLQKTYTAVLQIKQTNKNLDETSAKLLEPFNFLSRDLYTKDEMEKLNKKGTSYFREKKFDEALRCFKLAEKISIFLFGKNDFNTAICYNNIGATYREQSKYTKSLEFFIKCKNIYLLKYGKTDERTIKILSKITFVKEIISTCGCADIPINYRHTQS